MKKIGIGILCLLSTMAASAGIISTFPDGEVSTFTKGADLDFSGTYAYAANLGGHWNNQDVTIGNAVFNHDEVAEGVTVTGVGQGFVKTLYLGTAPSYAGDTTGLGTLMHPGYTTYGVNPSISLSMAVTPGQQYELNLLFSENTYQTANGRKFNIDVEGSEILADFTAIPLEAVWTGNPHTGVMVSYRFTAGDDTLNIDLTTLTSWSVDTPFIQAVALEVIPEPATLGMIGAGALLLLFMRRRV